jgi:hypothetical protein
MIPAYVKQEARGSGPIPGSRKLTRRGYIVPVDRGCEAPCEVCPLGSVCPLRATPRLWTVTEKGAAALAGRCVRDS